MKASRLGRWYELGGGAGGEACPWCELQLICSREKSVIRVFSPALPLGCSGSVAVVNLSAGAGRVALWGLVSALSRALQGWSQGRASPRTFQEQSCSRRALHCRARESAGNDRAGPPLVTAETEAGATGREARGQAGPLPVGRARVGDYLELRLWQGLLSFQGA